MPAKRWHRLRNSHIFDNFNVTSFAVTDSDLVIMSHGDFMGLWTHLRPPIQIWELKHPAARHAPSKVTQASHREIPGRKIWPNCNFLLVSIQERTFAPEFFARYPFWWYMKRRDRGNSLIQDEVSIILGNFSQETGIASRKLSCKMILYD